MRSAHRSKSKDSSQDICRTNANPTEHFVKTAMQVNARMRSREIVHTTSYNIWLKTGPRVYD